MYGGRKFTIYSAANKWAKRGITRQANVVQASLDLFLYILHHLSGRSTTPVYLFGIDE